MYWKDNETEKRERRREREKERKMLFPGRVRDLEDLGKPGLIARDKHKGLRCQQATTVVLASTRIRSLRNRSLPTPYILVE